MRRLLIMGVAALGLIVTGCSGGAAGDPEDDIGDIFVLTHSPGNGDQLNTEDSSNGFNALDNPTLTNPGAVTIVFTNSLDPTSVLNPTPGDPQGTRNVRLFFFDLAQGPCDPNQPTVPGVNPPGANVLVTAQTVLTTTNMPNDTLIIQPTGVSATNPLPEGQYSVIVEQGVRGADGDGLKGREFFFFFRVGQDNLGPVVVDSTPAPGQSGVDPTSEIRATMSETILASTVSSSTLSVSFQPAGAANPIQIPGNWFTDGGNGPGNNFPNVQLDVNGNPGFSGTSPRNGVDLVFRPNLDAFPVNMTAEDPFDPLCTLISDPPRKGNKGLPLGQAITVAFVFQGTGVTDTAGNGVPQGSPNTSLTFQTRSLPTPIFAPNANSAVYYGDTVGVGVIDVQPNRTPYFGGPNPARTPNSVVATNAGTVVRFPVPDLVDMTTDTRPYTSFYNMICSGAGAVRFFSGNLYAASASTGGGEVVVLDTFNMVPLGRFGTPSPGGVALTAFQSDGRLVVSNFSANTVTVFDIGNVSWFTGGALPATTGQLAGMVSNGSAQLLLSEEDFERAFPTQRANVAGSPPGPPLVGTINVGVGPTKVKISGLPNSLGIGGLCASPVMSTNLIVASLNAGENTADFSELINLNQSAAIEPDLDGVNLASQPVDIAWSPFSFNTGSYYFYISSIGGSVELFATGFASGTGPSVRENSSTNFAPNKIINSFSGLRQPSAIQWAPTGSGTVVNQIYSASVLVAETGENRVQEIAVTSEVPSNRFEAVKPNLSSGLGPVDITGEPQSVAQGSGPFGNACTPQFTEYYVANAGEGTVRTADSQGAIIGAEIPVPGVLFIASWWSR